MTVFAFGVDTPWDLAWGPDGVIWCLSEADESRASIRNPARSVAGTIGVVQSGEGG